MVGMILHLQGYKIEYRVLTATLHDAAHITTPSLLCSCVTHTGSNTIGRNVQGTVQGCDLHVSGFVNGEINVDIVP